MGQLYMAARDVPSAVDLATGGGGDADEGWTLRFPRIRPHGLRCAAAGGADDKPWYDCMTERELRDAIRRSQDPASARRAGAGARAPAGDVDILKMAV